MVNCLLLVTGSVAAIKTWKLRAEILKHLPPNSEVRVVLTQAAQHFLTPSLAQYPDDFDFSILPPSHPQHEQVQLQEEEDEDVTKKSSSSSSSNKIVFFDQDEWDSYQKRGDAVLHIELRKWADVCCVAPLDANSLAKIATGLADNLLSCVMRAWEWKKKSVVLAPAMNTAMWEHPLTRPQLDAIQGFGKIKNSNNNNKEEDEEVCDDKVFIVEPVSKVLECNDVGVGALAPLEDIAKAVAAAAVKI